MNNNMIIDIDDKPKKILQWVLLSLQHFFAMFCANTLISLLVFASYDLVPAALISAGIGTIVYLFITKFRSPIFLGSSAGLIGVMSAGFTILGSKSNYLGLIIGLAFIGLLYPVVAFIISKVGINWLLRLLPPIVTGPIIMVIGLSLAPFAVNWSVYNVMNTTGNDIFNIWSFSVAIITMLFTAFIACKGKGILKTLPYISGIGFGYIIATIISCVGYASGNILMQLIDFSTFTSIDWVPDFAFIKAINQPAPITWEAVLNIILIAVPISFVTICEHIGDHLNVSNITGRNLLKDPGLSRTLLGDGIATVLGGVIGGMGNTTYGENSSVIAVSKVASSRVVLTGAIVAILVGFCAPVMVFVKTIPACIFGAISLTIYGAISISGLKQLQKIDFNDNRNLLIASVILVAGVGGLFMQIGSFTFAGVSLAMVLGVILNLILR